MRIALDFDGTYSEHPVFWDDFIKLAHGHLVGVDIVTIRHETLDKLRVERHLIDLGCRVIYCDGKPKWEVVKALGHHIDIWIDDHPESVSLGTNLNSEQLEAWRKNDVHRETSNGQQGSKAHAHSYRGPRLLP